MSLYSYIPLLLTGTVVTVAAWLLSGVLSLSLGAIMGTLSCNRLGSPITKKIIWFYTFIAKGIPAYVQILIAYFVIPALTGLQIPGFFAACGALAFCSSGYVTEIIRSGINALPRGQWDACLVLGYSPQAALKRIIFPQLLRNTLPALMGECEQLLKSTSLFATIGVMELTRSGMNIISRELNPIPVYLTIAGIYLLFSAMLHYFVISREKSTHYGQR